MNELDLVDVSNLNLYYTLKKNIPFNDEKITLVSYLEALKEFDQKNIAGNMKIIRKYGFILIIIAFCWVFPILLQ